MDEQIAPIPTKAAFEIYEDKTRLRWAMPVCMILLILLEWWIQKGSPSAEIYICFGVLILTVIIGVVRLFLPPQLILQVNEVGLAWRAIICTHFIAWHEITSVSLIPVIHHGITFHEVCVSLKDEKSYLSKLPRWKRNLIACLPHAHKHFITIPETFLPGRAQQLVDLFNFYLAKQAAAKQAD